MLFAGAGSFAATVTAEFRINENSRITGAKLIRRTPTPEGVTEEVHPGKVDGSRVTFTDLPADEAGWYDMKLTMQMLYGDEGVVEGWNPRVPASDYEQEQPLSDAAIRKIQDKIADLYKDAFPDVVQVLSISGNIQNAAVLVFHLRTRPFTTAGFNKMDWIFRVDRMQWRDPNEETWTMAKQAGSFSLLYDRQYKQLYPEIRWMFAEQLGGIVLKDADETRDLGTIALPDPPYGFHACTASGNIIEPVTLKGKLPEPEE